MRIDFTENEYLTLLAALKVAEITTVSEANRKRIKKLRDDIRVRWEVALARETAAVAIKTEAT